MTTLLLVEDNEMNRDMLTRRLERRGYTVHTAEDGNTAVQKALSGCYAVVLMDMELPIKDGWTASTEIKRQSNIPIIALTAHALSGAREKALAAGCDAYATKPIDFPALLKTIETSIDITKADHT